MESLQGEMFFFFPRPFYSQAHKIGTNSNAFTQIVMLSPKDSARSDITKQKVSWCHMVPLVRRSLFRKYGFLIYKLLLACIHWLTLQFHTWQNRQVLSQMGSLFQTQPRLELTATVSCQNMIVNGYSKQRQQEWTKWVSYKMSTSYAFHALQKANKQESKNFSLKNQKAF